MTHIAIVGGGIAGLATAHALVTGPAARRVRVTVVERAARAGGNIGTEVIDGFVCEWGPNGFLDNVPATLDLVKALGLEAELEPSAASARRRYIYRHGRLHALPVGVVDFLRSDLLSWPAKLRLAVEPFATSRPEVDETIHAFAARRIGREAADVLIDAMVSGIFGGDSRALSLRACFPKMFDMETAHGGLFRAMLARRRRHPRRNGEAIGEPLGRLTSFRGGSATLVAALAARLGAVVRCGVGVQAVSSHGGHYRLHLESGECLDADAVVLSAGAPATSRMVRDLDATLADVLAEIPTAPMVVVALGYEASRLPRPLDGFGFLVPRGEGLRTLGVLWDSSVYPGRAPHGQVLLRAMVGGATDPRILDLDDETLVAGVRADLQTTMGIDVPPHLVHVFRHPLGIPQYTVGHLERLARAERCLQSWPGLVLAGNAYRGVSINSCIAEASTIAERVLAVSARRSDATTDAA
jgi:oxygen-dependent protoporphyrinogen oxidase